MSPLEVYHYDGSDWEKEPVLVVTPGKSAHLEPTYTDQRFLLECAASNNYSIITQVSGGLKGGRFLTLSEMKTKVVYQGQTHTLIFNPGTRRESMYRLMQVPTAPVVPNWQRTGRSR